MSNSANQMEGTGDTAESRRRRKEDGRLRKKQKIADSGGVRPRQTLGDDISETTKKQGKTENGDRESGRQQNNRTERANRQNRTQFTSNHRFGRVMESVPCRNKPRYSTLSIAVPGSILSNCQTRELRTLMVGQIARAATIYHVDEIIVFDDNLANRHSNGGNSGWRRRPRHDKHNGTQRETKEPIEVHTENQPSSEPRARSDPHTFMARVLQYCECPQYLRRHFFPMHPDLQFAGLLAPIDAPHHVRAEDRSPYREGVVLEKKHPKSSNNGRIGFGGGSLVNCGIRSRPVE